MKNTFSTSDWFLKDSIELAKQSLFLCKALSARSIRVRRRGFSASVRRGDIVRHSGKSWNVARRSNWHLWLYEHVEMQGQTVSVKLPTRYLTH